MDNKRGKFKRFLDSPVLMWDKKIPNTQLEDFKRKVEEKYNISLANYWDLHKWSVENFETFWEETWKYFNIKFSKPYDQVLRRTGNGFMDIEWFPGTLFNAAENLLRIRDNRIAIIHSDETNYEESVTYAELYEQVKLYVAAFRKHGLQKNDVVACYMSNRKEAVFTYLAAVSIGAIFSGPQPFLGARAASNIIHKLEPKFLICVDYHLDDGIEYNLLSNLTEITKNTPSMDKVIIIPTRQETNATSLLNIPNSVFLSDFLESGIESDGIVPDIVFEQLPFDHPVSINFTSGTTGLPKGPVHSAGTILPELISIVFYYDLRPGDVMYSCYPVGWSLWNLFIHGLAYGVTLFLYAGNPLYKRSGSNIWDIFAQYKVTMALLITSMVEKLDKLGAEPAPDSNLDLLKFITIGGSPVKAQNCLYIKNKVKHDVFVSSIYGSTESFGSFAGLDLNTPSYAGENHVPGLGANVQCFNNEGKHVVGEQGEMVIATPTISLPIYIWKDNNNKIMTDTYLSKFPGFWCQHDEILVNQLTNGIIVFGRSDDTLIQNGDRFGSGDVYFAIHDIEEIQDYICVGQTRLDGETRAVLFIKMKTNFEFSPEFKAKVEQKIFDELWADCVPQAILEIPDIPYNINNKRMESVVRKILATNEIPEVNNIKNPECLTFYRNIPEIVSFMKM